MCKVWEIFYETTDSSDETYIRKKKIKEKQDDPAEYRGSCAVADACQKL